LNRIITAAAIALGLAVAAATPALAMQGTPAHVSPRTTTVFDEAYAGAGNEGYLTIPTTIGHAVYFSGMGADVAYVKQSQGLYWVNPPGHPGICMTDDTSNTGVILAEVCVHGATNQLWDNSVDLGNPSLYKDILDSVPKYLTDPVHGSGNYNATLGLNGSNGPVGSTLLQGS
jgi:hypothetical protein